MKRLWAGLILLWAPVSISAQKPGAEVRAMQQFTDIVQPDDGTKACRDTGTNWMGLATFTCVRSNSRPDTIIVMAQPGTEHNSLIYFANELTENEAQLLRDKLESWAKAIGARITECTAKPNSDQSGTGIYFRTKEFFASYTRRTSSDSSIRAVAGFQVPYTPAFDPICPGAAGRTGMQ